MTPKEKAEDLIDSFLRDGYAIVMENRLAKRCALIAVDEILNLKHPLRIIYHEHLGNEINQMTQEYYWQQVKHEIEEL